MTDFKIVFDKLSEAVKTDGKLTEWRIVSEVTPQEMDEIAELCRLSDELSTPEMKSYTTT